MLKDISFHVEPGQTVGIIGATGSGKSSLVNLICRFYDVNQGRVLVDDIDVRNLNLRRFAKYWNCDAGCIFVLRYNRGKYRLWKSRLYI